MNVENTTPIEAENQVASQQSPGKTEMTPAARRMVERHIAYIRLLLRGARGVVIDEVLADVREHIAAGLAELGAPAPADLADIKHVLQRLGPPEQWISPDDLPYWRRTLLPFLHRLNLLPKLPFLALLFAALGLLGAGTPPGLVFFGVGFCLARAWVARHGASIEAWQKWLVYPPLAIVYLTLGIPALIWPALMIFGGDFFDPQVPRFISHMVPAPLSLQHFAAAGVAVGLWWLLIGAALCMLPALGRFLVRPFADSLSRRGAAFVASAGTLVSVAAWWILTLHR
jgi:hypothetical protein